MVTPIPRAAVRLTLRRYCPPRLVESGAIWTTFSIIGKHVVSKSFKAEDGC